MRMKNRQSVQQHILRREAPMRRQCFGITGEIVMAEHRAFGAARGAGCIEQRRQIIGPARRIGKFGGRSAGKIGQRAILLHAKRGELDMMRGAKGHGLLCPLRCGDKQGGFSIAQKIIQLRAGIGRVERHEHRPRPHTGEIEKQRIRAFFHLHIHPIARLYPKPDQGVSEARRLRQHVPISVAHTLWRLDKCAFL